jgi:hypothetical protein
METISNIANRHNNKNIVPQQSSQIREKYKETRKQLFLYSYLHLPHLHVTRILQINKESSNNPIKGNHLKPTTMIQLWKGPIEKQSTPL